MICVVAAMLLFADTCCARKQVEFSSFHYSNSNELKWNPEISKPDHVYVLQNRRIKFTASAGFNRMITSSIDVEALLDGNLMQALYGINPGDAIRWDARIKYRFTSQISVTGRWLRQEPASSYALTLAYHAKIKRRNKPVDFY
jgi:hypothetical protein